MIDLYYWTTPNGHKITIFLEETGLPYSDQAGQHRQGRAVRARRSSRSRRTTASRRSSTTSRPTAARRCRCSSRARSCSISPSKTGRFIPHDLRGALRVRCSGCSGRWPGSGPMAGQNHHFAHLRAGEDPVRDRPLREGDGAPLRGARQAARRPRVHRRRLLDRRHGVLSVDHPGAPGPGHHAVPTPVTLARRDRRAAGGREGLRAREDASTRVRPRR